MSEQQATMTAQEPPEGHASWPDYWKPQGMAWRTEPEIPADRQAYLGELRAIEPNIEQGVYPFKGVEPKLTRADIEWLLATHESRGIVGPVIWEEEKDKPKEEQRQGLDLRGTDLARTDLTRLPLTCARAGLSFEEYLYATKDQRSAAAAHLEGANLGFAHLEGANFGGSQLTGADLRWAPLERANLRWAQLQDADLHGTQPNWADFYNAQLERANLHLAKLEGAHLGGAHLQEANLNFAQLKGAGLGEAQLAGANLGEARLEEADLRKANLERADLRGASLDKATQLNDAVLVLTSLDQATFDNTNLSVVDWKQAPILGDEVTAQTAKDNEGKRKSRQQRIADYQAAVRAYRRLAVALQANGLSAESANYLYRAAIMERRLARHERRAGAYFFSVLLAVLAGYGYRLGRIVVAYITVVAAFALAFLAARYYAGTVIDWEQVGEATQISLNAIHGRVFFAQLALDSVQAWIATIESVVGIVIEGVFVAMLIQRFFGR